VGPIHLTIGATIIVFQQLKVYLRFFYIAHHFTRAIKGLVQKFLCCPPSTVESERTFSKLGEIFKPKRFSLSEEHAKQQLFLNFNYGY
jgi:hypothetical protein